MVDSTNLPDVDINQIATDLNGKMDRDGVNATASVCVESWHEGTEWYRVYSDGWCEQGGFYSGTSFYTLLKPYVNNNYTLTLGCYRQGSNDDYAVDYCNNKSATGFSCIHVWNGGSAGATVYWQAKGYIR